MLVVVSLIMRCRALLAGSRPPSHCMVVFVHVQQTVDFFVRVVNLLSLLRSSQDDLAACKYEQDDFGFGHAENKSREELGVVAARDSLLFRMVVQRFQFNLKAHVVRADDVLNGEVGEPYAWVSDFLELTGVALGRGVAV